jgi:NADH-quinone oxidoreductase subunit J
MELSSKLYYGALALLGLALLGVGLAGGGAPGLAFGLFAVLIVCGGLMVVWERSVVRSAFALLVTLLGVSGMFLLLHADFLAMAQILIYVGGILALILFGVMLAPPDMEERQIPRVVGSLAVVGLAFGWVAVRVAETARWVTSESTAPTDLSNAERIGLGFLRADQYVVAFELAAVVLTVALVAAVYIARRRRQDFEPEAEA